MDKSICLPTLNPKLGGGIGSVNTLSYKQVKQAGYDPYLLFNSRSSRENITIPRFLKGKVSIGHEHYTVDGMESVKIGRVFPRLKIFDYILNVKHWDEEINNADKCLGLGAHCLPCLPAAISGIDFGCWIGTTICDELKSQIGGFRFTRDIRERIAFPLTKQYEKYTLKRANIIYSQSHYTKQRIIDIYGISESKIKVIHYPINTEKFVPENDKKYKEVVFVGRLSDPRKNVKHLINSFSKVLNIIPEAKLTLVGDELTKNLRSLIEELEIKESIDCVGKVPEVISYMNRASVFVLPSEQEGLGIVGLEAQSCGTPVIATRCGGPEDYVEDGINGFLVPKKDSGVLADRIIQILTNDELRTKLGENARTNVVENYSQEVIGKKINTAIKELPCI